MSGLKRISFKDYCDFLSAYTTIQVDYHKIDMLGAPRSYATAVGFSCEHSSKCPDSNLCPLFKTASQNYDW